MCYNESKRRAFLFVGPFDAAEYRFASGIQYRRRGCRYEKRFFGEEAEAKITATVEKSAKIVEITVAHGGMIFRAEERAEDMEDALDGCVDSLVRQIRKNKTRVEKRLRSGAFDAYTDMEPVSEELDFDVVRTKKIPLNKPQDVDEAILQMNLLDHDFYVFRNSDDDSISIVYHRKNGGYGLIVTDEEE